MSKVQAKHQVKKHDDKTQTGKKSNVIYYTLATVAVVLALIFVPKVIGGAGVSFLAAGTGLNKLFSVVVAALAGWAFLLPSQGYKDFIDLAKGAHVEWRKTVKPDRDTVIRTTMMVLALVALFALLILVLDWVIGSILRGFII